MNPIKFEHSNITLGAPSPNNTGAEIDSINAWTDATSCVSCWRMSWRERFSALIFGRVWLDLLSGKTMPPAYVVACKEYFEEEQ